MFSQASFCSQGEGIPGPISFLGVGISGLRSLLGVGGYAWSQIHSWREDMSGGGGGAWYVQGVVPPRHVPEEMVISTPCY